MNNITQMIQKASQMKQKMQEMQEHVRQVELDGEAGGGLVKCRINGRFELKTIRIDPSLVKPDEVEIMEDMIVVAINDARVKAEKLMGEETKKIMSDLGLPAGLGLPF
ncbi:MAG: YbaB/EbfC family nucleoid-associated protein [Alphaproteobacteria bacterium]|nr:YbaB/EbfC family nucleoid-associated protein [Alphaproteobacteria bacterium]MCK5658717.1 YbaB/EbfC family nucleoid-associated protein [Alphaproteobacteria bacterium]